MTAKDSKIIIAIIKHIVYIYIYIYIFNFNYLLCLKKYRANLEMYLENKKL